MEKLSNVHGRTREELVENIKTYSLALQGLKGVNDQYNKELITLLDQDLYWATKEFRVQVERENTP